MRADRSDAITLLLHTHQRRAPGPLGSPPADVLEEIDGPMLQYGLKAVHGSSLILPRQREQRPNRDFLAERFEQFRVA